MPVVKHEFQSLSEIPGWFKANPRQSGSRDSEYYDSDRDWSYDVKLPEATEIAAKGGRWDEGAKHMKEAVLTMANIRRAAFETTVDTDVTGYTVDVESYLAGDPNCMWSEGEDDTKPVQIIKVCVNIFMSARVTADQKLNYGAAVMSVIDNIESQGCRVELWAQYGSRSAGYETDLRVLLKEAHDHWSPSSVAFALAHAAFPRKIMFRTAESFKELDRWCSNYGSGCEVAAKDFDLYLPPMHGSCNWANNEESALKHVTALAQKKLTIMEKAA